MMKTLRLARSRKPTRPTILLATVIVLIFAMAGECNPGNGTNDPGSAGGENPPGGNSTIPPPDDGGVAGGVKPPGGNVIPITDLVETESWGQLVEQLEPLIDQGAVLTDGVYEHALAAYVLALAQQDTAESLQKIADLQSQGELALLSHMRLTGAFEEIRQQADLAANDAQGGG